MHPGTENLKRTLTTIDQAIHAAKYTDESCTSHFNNSSPWRVCSYLYLIRSSLFVPTSSLTELADRTGGQGAVHAS